jgi:hypothetical protein
VCSVCTSREPWLVGTGGMVGGMTGGGASSMVRM